MEIIEIDNHNNEQLAHLFFEFWPDETTLEKELISAKKILKNDSQQAFLVRIQSESVGFIQVSIRHEYVDGMTTPFVGYIEGLYVRKGYRSKGIGRKLIAKGEDWARAQGCTQMGSDTGIENENSIGFHKHLGYGEIHRYVSFMKEL